MILQWDFGSNELKIFLEILTHVEATHTNCKQLLELEKKKKIYIYIYIYCYH